MAYLDRLADAPLATVPARHRAAHGATRRRSAGVRGSCTRPASSTRAARPVGVYLQITTAPQEDLAIPGRDFTFGDFIAAQAGGDAAVLAEHGRPGAPAAPDRPRRRAGPAREGARRGRFRGLRGSRPRRGMSPARVAAGTNPLRDPRDRRLPRIAGPCGMVMFGVTGDLSRKKLMPAIYDLANRGLLPPGFSLVGFARRDWADEDFGQVVYQSVRDHARTPFREDVWRNLAEGFRFVPGTFDDPAAFDLLADDRARPGAPARHRRQPRVLPVDPARVVLAGLRAAEALRPRRRPRGGLATGRHREAVRPRPGQRPRAQHHRRDGVPGRLGVPDRPLPGQGDGPEPVGAPVRQPDVRADLERQLRRPRADHHGRGHRHRRPRRLLRRHRRRPRRHPEPPAPAARAHRDGGAGLVQRPRPAGREGEGALRRHASPPTSAATPRAASTPTGGRARRRSSGTSRSRASPRAPRPRRMRR